ncbi:MAG: hypothetical protein IJW77_08575 [Clostridia bacterium]|nr:hypothetical protein [Clostridia bacterium]
MKKYIRLFCIVLLLMSLAMHVSAAVVQPIKPMWDHINDMTCGISFSGTTGTAYASITSDLDTTQIIASLAVYKQIGTDEWEYVEHTMKRVTSFDMALSVEFTGEPGAYYKAVFNATVTNDGTEENEILFAYRTCPKS